MQPYLAPRSTVALYGLAEFDPCLVESSRVAIVWLKQEESASLNAAMDSSEELPIVGR